MPIVLRRALLGVGVLVCVVALALVGELGWLLFQPGGGTYNAYQAAEHTWERYPGPGRYVARAYIVFEEATSGDVQHYVVHEAAALVAMLAGYPRAAREQELRAAPHRPW